MPMAASGCHGHHRNSMKTLRTAASSEDSAKLALCLSLVNFVLDARYHFFDKDGGLLLLITHQWPEKEGVHLQLIIIAHNFINPSFGWTYDHTGAPGLYVLMPCLGCDSHQVIRPSNG